MSVAEATAPATIAVKSGEIIWEAGEKAPAIRIKTGAVAYVTGQCAIGILGPEQVTLPIPGIKPADEKTSVAATRLMAITDVVYEVCDLQTLGAVELEISVKALIEHAALYQEDAAQRFAKIVQKLCGLLKTSTVACKQDYLATLVGVRREHLSTIIGTLRESDAFRMKYRGFTVRDHSVVDRLARTAGYRPEPVVHAPYS